LTEKKAKLATKRAYEPPASGDGWRVLVDRLWPRGVSKARLQLDAWVRGLAPSTELRKWFRHDPDRWEEFVRRYREELRAAEQEALLSDLTEHARHGTVTLIYAARDTEHNEAAVLQDVLQERLRDIFSTPGG
jgi:uncharacterized protein YeaO (DUF488 family)